MASHKDEKTASLTLHLWTNPFFDQGVAQKTHLMGTLALNANKLHGTKAVGPVMLNPPDFDRYFTQEGRELIKDLLRQGGWNLVDAVTHAPI